MSWIIQRPKRRTWLKITGYKHTNGEKEERLFTGTIQKKKAYLQGHYKRRKFIYWDNTNEESLFTGTVQKKKAYWLGQYKTSANARSEPFFQSQKSTVNGWYMKTTYPLRLDFRWNAWSVWNIVWISSWDSPRQYLFGHNSAINMFKQTITSLFSWECFNSAWLHGLATTMTSGVGVEGDDVGLLRLLTPNRPDCISQHQWSDWATTRDLLRMVTSTIDLSDGLPRGNVAAPGCDAEST